MGNMGKLRKTMHTPLAKYRVTKAFPKQPCILPNFPHSAQPCNVGRLFLTWWLCWGLLITPYREFNHFPKTSRRTAGQQPASWGKAGECDKLPETFGEISSFPHLSPTTTPGLLTGGRRAVPRDLVTTAGC